MKFLVMTDIHLTTPGSTISGRDPIANFNRALDHALKEHADAAFLAITGDLSDWGDETDYQLLKDRLSSYPMPTSLCIGNHDERPVFLKVYPELADAGGFVQGVRDTPEGRCLFLDTWGPESHAGFYCEARCAWLSEQLETHPGPFFLFMHHNPIPMHVAVLDEIGLIDSAAFGAVVRPHAAKIRHIFFGHCHLPLAGSFHGIPVSSMRGTNHAAWTGFGDDAVFAACDLPESYAVVFTTPETVTVHTVEFGYDGEIRTEGSPDYADWNRAEMVR